MTMESQLFEFRKFVGRSDGMITCRYEIFRSIFRLSPKHYVRFINFLEKRGFEFAMKKMEKRGTEEDIKKLIILWGLESV